MEKIVKKCKDCPFLYIEYDDFSIGDSFLKVCVLSYNNGNGDWIINSYSDIDDDEDDIPDWCPLKDNNINVKFEE